MKDEQTQARVPSAEQGRWTGGAVPPRVQLGLQTLVNGEHAFKRFHARSDGAGLSIGNGCTMDGVQFAVGAQASVSIGSHCHFTNAVLLCERELRIGSYVMIGWNVTIADTDFHPIDPALRLADAVACSPLGDGRPRPFVDASPVIIEDDVFIGPAATILKGVTIGRGAWIEAGAVVTRDVRPTTRVFGNPAREPGKAHS